MDIIAAIQCAMLLDENEPGRTPPVAVLEVRPLVYSVGRDIPDGTRPILYIDGGVVPF